MTTWKRLTSDDNRKVEVNMDTVTFMSRSSVTTLHFVGGEPKYINVKETIERIQEIEGV